LFQLIFNHDVGVFDCRFPESIQFRRNLTGILADKFQKIQQLISTVYYADVGDKKKVGNGLIRANSLLKLSISF